MTFADLSAKKISGECGLGELDLTMTGTQEDYNYDLECGVGNLDVGSDSYSGLGREKSISNTGADRKLDLELRYGKCISRFLWERAQGFVDILRRIHSDEGRNESSILTESSSYLM